MNRFDGIWETIAGRRRLASPIQRFSHGAAALHAGRRDKAAPAAVAPGAPPCAHMFGLLKDIARHAARSRTGTHPSDFQQTRWNSSRAAEILGVSYKRCFTRSGSRARQNVGCRRTILGRTTAC
jgi:hypothetical protein